MGDLLSADYYNRDLTTREMVKRMNTETLQEARTAGEKVMIRKGNDYALPYADLITDMNLTGQAYAIVDEPPCHPRSLLTGVRLQGWITARPHLGLEALQLLPDE